MNEWAQNSAPAFYSPPGYEVAAGGVGDIMVGGDESERSQVGSSGEHASRIGSEDLDVVSDDEMRISTPGSWSEVGSQFSEDY